MRYFIEISYDGTDYHGWQLQHNAVSVQQRINEALSKKLGGEVNCVGSSRTDAGVHALMQTAHFDTAEEWKHPQDLAYALNALLPPSISVDSAYRVRDEASARLDAQSRSYIYKIHRRKNPFASGFSYYFSRPLDVDRMNEACKLLLSWRDYQAFSKVHTDVHTFDCEVFSAQWERQNDSLAFYITANRFLRGMVRSLVGTMLDIGENKIALADFQAILESKDRRRAGQSVAACGLYLSQVTYPDSIRY